MLYLNALRDMKEVNMFGYVTVHKEELKMKDYTTYKGFYCGLCRTLQVSFGPVGQSTLTYDMTFFVILLTSLYESEIKKEQHRCVVHPVKKQLQLRNEISQYAADMNMIMSYYHFKDDWDDEQRISGFVGKTVLTGTYKKICEKYPRQSAVIKEQMEQLNRLEKENSYDLDQVSGTFGKLMGELFVLNEDQWSTYLREFGFNLGKFIYLMDAYDDLESDKKKHVYNPLTKLSMEKKEEYEAVVRDSLTLLMTEATENFEKLPCLEFADILRNILYVGVWEKYDRIQRERLERNIENDRSI